MMLKALLKVRLAAFGAYFTGASRSRRRQSKVQKIGMLALMLYALAAFGMLFYTSFSAIAGIYAHEGFGWLYFAMYAIMAFALMVFGSVFTAKAQLYEAKDNELLLSMPIAPRAILASRMASLWLLNLIFGLVVAVPAALAWAQAALPVLGWVSIVLLLPALDFFSLAVTSLLAWGLSLLASRLRRKSLVTVIGSVVFLGAYFAVVFRMNGYIEQLAQNGAAIAESLAGAKLLVWLGRAMAQGNALALLWSLLALLLPFALMYWVLDHSFIRIVTTKRGAAKIRYEEKTLETSSPDRALVRREFRRLWASPTYLLNAGMGVLFLLVGAAALVIRRAAILDLAVQLPELAASVPVFLLLAICGMLGTTFFTPSSVSLEGKSLWILQSMPVSGCQVLLSKLRMADSLTLPTAAIAGICCASVTDRAPLVLAAGVLFARFVNLLGLREGVLHAKLDWTNEAQAVKQGWATMLTMLLCWGVILSTGALWLMWLAELVSAEAFLLGFCAVFFALDALLLRWVKTTGAERFSHLS